jgi:hypothetical protein
MPFCGVAKGWWAIANRELGVRFPVQGMDCLLLLKYLLNLIIQWVITKIVVKFNWKVLSFFPTVLKVKSEAYRASLADNSAPSYN